MKPPPKTGYRPLSPRQIRFSQLRVNGIALLTAYAQAGYSMRGCKQGLEASSWRLENHPKIKDYIKSLQQSLWEKESLSLSEKRAYLAKAVRTPISEITKESPLAQEYTPTEFGPKIKAISKLEAINLDSKLAGHFQQESSSQNPFQFLVALNLNIASDPLHSTVIEI